MNLYPANASFTVKDLSLDLMSGWNPSRNISVCVSVEGAVNNRLFSRSGGGTLHPSVAGWAADCKGNTPPSGRRGDY